jgi:hypothetical protein
MIAGYRVDSDNLNVIAFDTSNNQMATVRVVYGQFNTGTTADEVYGEWTARFSRATGAYLVKDITTVDSQRCNLVMTESSSRLLLTVNRTGGAVIRVEAANRWVYVEVMGAVSSITLDPTTI